MTPAQRRQIARSLLGAALIIYLPAMIVGVWWWLAPARPPVFAPAVVVPLPASPVPVAPPQPTAAGAALATDEPVTAAPAADVPAVTPAVLKVSRAAPRRASKRPRAVRQPAPARRATGRQMRNAADEPVWRRHVFDPESGP